MAQNLISARAIEMITLTLRLLGQDYPAIQDEVAYCIRRIEAKFKFRGPDKDAVLILKAIRDSYHTASEIAEKTKIPHSTVCKRLSEMEAAGLLRTTKQAEPTIQHGGDRKTLLYWLTPDWQALYKAQKPKPQAVQIELFPNERQHGKGKG